VDRAERTSTQLGRRLTQAAAQTIVGRDREQAQLRDWFRRGAGPAVVVVSGPGGIGKSALVAGVAAAIASEY
jgi:Mrp family chromosome partitioning ATPase